MSTWLFDLGNTRLKCAELRADGAPGEVHALAHADADVERALAMVLPDRFDRAVVAGVAGTGLTAAVLDALTRHTRRLTRVRTSATCAGLRLAYHRPQRLGVDRFLALLAAHAEARDVLVCGVGTALTIDLLDRDGQHHGGRIAPSPTLMREVLHARAAQLPATGGAYREFADDTDDALVSGCEGAAIALVERSVREARDLLGRDVQVWLHGGGAEALRGAIANVNWRPDLVLAGLARWTRVDAEAAGDGPLQSAAC